MTLLGIQTVSGKNKEGKAYSGYRLHFSYPIDKKYGEGTAVENVYISDHYLEEMPKLGDDVNVLYNRYGRPVGLAPAR